MAKLHDLSPTPGSHRNRKRIGLYCFKHNCERTPLVFGRNDLRVAISLPFHAKRVVLTANDFRRRFDLITVIHVDRDEHFFDRRHRCAFANVVLTKAL